MRRDAVRGEIAAAFAARPAKTRARLMRLRKLVLDTARGMDVAVEEALRWGQPAFLSRSGSTIRIDATKAGGVALYFICRTDLVARFRERYPELSYDGNRAILLDGALPVEKLRHCIALALSYRRKTL